MRLILSLLSMGVLLMGCSDSATELQKKIDRFKPVVITADTSSLPPSDRYILEKLVAAAKIMDTLYLQQSWSGSLDLLKRLEADTSPEGQARLHFFRINMGPWSGLDGGEAFVPGAPPSRPPQANFYPDDMTKEEFTGWVSTLSDEEKQKATGYFWTIRRGADRTLKTVPYNEEYRDYLVHASALLQEAAAMAEEPTLKAFLSKRATGFLSNDYYDSDVAWMDLESRIEPTIGPYEVYMDELFNYKAAFEAFICIRNDDETAKLGVYSQYLQEIEDNLPIAPALRNPKLGALAPIRVVDQLVVGGESRAGVQTAAFNLPNDERVVAEKGSKRVMLRNVQQAKFQNILQPIAAITIDPGQREHISFDAFFTHILMHELMHGLGPHTIMLEGEKTTVRQAMRELSSAFEEAKADISGLFALQYLIDRGVVPRSMEEPLYVTFLASSFRSLRFGIREAHGRGMALQLSYLMDAGAITYDQTGERTGTFSVDIPRFKEAAKKLTGEIMTIQAEGSYTKAKEMLDRLAVLQPAVQRTLDQLTSIPVDIEPVSSLPRSGSAQ